MVSPHRRREAVCVLQRRLGISERRACEITGQHRSTQRYGPSRLQMIRRFAARCAGSAAITSAGAIAGPTAIW